MMTLRQMIVFFVVAASFVDCSILPVFYNYPMQHFANATATVQLNFNQTTSMGCVKNNMIDVQAELPTFSFNDGVILLTDTFAPNAGSGSVLLGSFPFASNATFADDAVVFSSKRGLTKTVFELEASSASFNLSVNV